MAKKSLYLFGILLAIILGTILNWKLCCNLLTEAEASPIAEEEVPTNPLSIEDTDGSFLYKDNDNFNFEASGFNILMPLSEGVQRGVDSLKSYLDAHPEKFVEVTGYYDPSETNTSAFPNLGLARATHIKNYLVSRGIPSKQIHTKGESKSNLALYNGIYIGPDKIGITTESMDNDESLKALGESIKGSPLVIHFEYGESEIALTDEEKQIVANISKYLDKVDDASCQIIGHTDNTSSAEFNYDLGVKRAEFVKNYFVTHGIPASKITTSSKGETEPVADNSTDEGRAQNRRTVVTIN